MRSTRWTAVVAMLAVAAATLGSDARAGDTPGTVPDPTGTIYFQDLSTLDASTNAVTLYAMDGKGQNVAEVIRTDRYVRPSRLLHGSSDPTRWFLTLKTVEGREIGGNPRRDVYAVRADGGTVRLTSDPSVEYWMPEWVPGENQDFAVVSMLGRRWTSDAPDATVVPRTAGMYFCRLEFDGTRDVTNVRGSDAGGNPVAAISHPVLGSIFYDGSITDRNSSAYFGSLGGPTPDVASYSWSPDSSWIAVQDLSAETPRIRVIPYDGDWGWVDRWEGQDPDWGQSRDGHNDSRVAFRRLVPADGQGSDTSVIETAFAFGVNGAARVTEASVPHPATANSTQSLLNPKMSPDGNWIAHQLQRTGTGSTNYVYAETGVGLSNLTPGVKRAAAGATGMALVAWR